MTPKSDYDPPEGKQNSEAETKAETKAEAAADPRSAKENKKNSKEPKNSTAKKNSKGSSKAPDHKKPRNVKFTEEGLAVVSVMRQRDPKATLSDIVDNALQLFFKQTAAATQVRSSLLQGKEYALVLGALATIAGELRSFRKDLLNVEIVKIVGDTQVGEIVEKIEAQLTNADALQDRIGKLVGVSDLNADKLELLALVISDIEVQSNAPETDVITKHKLLLALKLLKTFLP